MQILRALHNIGIDFNAEYLDPSNRYSGMITDRIHKKLRIMEDLTKKGDRLPPRADKEKEKKKNDEEKENATFQSPFKKSGKRKLENDSFLSESKRRESSSRGCPLKRARSPATRKLSSLHLQVKDLMDILHSAIVKGVPIILPHKVLQLQQSSSAEEDILH